MASRKNKALYDLVQVLSPVEKRYLQQFWPKTKSAKSKAGLLLAAFGAANEPDEAELKARYAERGYQAAYLAADRYQVYEAILEGLAEFRAEEISELSLSRWLQKARILFDKAQIQACLDYVQEGLKRCEAQEHWALALAFCPLQLNCLRLLGQTAALAQALAQQTRYYEHLADNSRLLHWHSLSMDWRRSLGKIREAQALAPFEALLETLETFMQERPKEGYFYPWFHYLEIYGNYYFVKDEAEAEYRTNLRLLELMQAHAWYIADRPLNQVVIQTRLLILSRRLRPDNFLEALAAYRDLGQSSNRQSREIAATVFIFSYNYEIEHQLSLQDYAAAFALLPEMQKGLKKHHKQIAPDLALSAYYRMSVAAIFMRQAAKALDYLQVILTQFEPALRPELYRMSLLLVAICHYQLGHSKLLPALISQARYHSRKRQTLYQSEALVLRGLARLAQAKTSLQSREILLKLYKKLEKLVEDSFERKSLAIFNFPDWISLELKNLASE